MHQNMLLTPPPLLLLLQTTSTSFEMQTKQENVMLKQQLKNMGAVAVEAVPLAVAERRMKDAVRRLLEGDASAEVLGCAHARIHLCVR